MAYVNDPLGLVGFFDDSGSGGGSTSTAAKDLNYQQDLLSYLMSPNTGMGTGTYDPMIAVPPEYLAPATTILDSFESSPTPVMQAVAKKIRAKIIDPANAVAEIANTLGITDTVSKNGMDMKSIRDAVASMFSEVTSVTDAQNKHTAAIKDWETTNQYGKGGFSQPYEEYTMDTLPFSSAVQDQQSQLDWLRRESEMGRGKNAPKSEADRQALYAKMLSEANFLPTDEDNVTSDVSKEEMGWVGAANAGTGSDMLGGGTNTISNTGRGAISNTDNRVISNTGKGAISNSGRGSISNTDSRVISDTSNNSISNSGRGSISDSGRGTISNTGEDSTSKYNITTGLATNTGGKKSTSNQDYNARLGMALSLKAGEQTRYTDPNEEKRKKLERSLLINKMAELAAAKYMGRTPFSDQMAGRASTI
jgi:hypothetical protein